MNDFFNNLGNFFGGLFGGNQQRSYSGPKDDYAVTDVDDQYDYIASGDYGDGNKVTRVGTKIVEAPAENVDAPIYNPEDYANDAYRKRKESADKGTLFVEPSEANGEAAYNGSLNVVEDSIVRNKKAGEEDNLDDYYELMDKFLSTLRREYKNPQDKYDDLVELSEDNRWNQFYNYAPFPQYNDNRGIPVAEGLKNALGDYYPYYDYYNQSTGESGRGYNENWDKELYDAYKQRVNYNKAYHRKKVA